MSLINLFWKKEGQLEEFKVGSKIVVIEDNEFDPNSPSSGDTGNVVEIDPMDVLIKVKFDSWKSKSGSPFWHISPSRIRKIYTNGRH